MAKQASERRMIQMTRNRGELRYGQTLRATDAEAEAKGLREGDYKVVDTDRAVRSEQTEKH